MCERVCVCVCVECERLYGYWIILNLDPPGCSHHILFYQDRFGRRTGLVFEQLSK